MELIWIIIGMVVIAALVVFFRATKKASNKDSSADEQKGAKDKPNQPEDDLIKLNLRLRKSAVDSVVTEKCENVIDQLVNLIPAINALEMPSTDMAWTVNQIAKEYLPNKCMGPYLNLTKEAREEKERTETVLSNLETLSKELKSVEELLNKRDVNEFNKKATFLQHRFNQNGEA